ncbi:hypothetical protein GCM10009610_42150 [Pseudonocardia xinjiangensis]
MRGWRAELPRRCAARALVAPPAGTLVGGTLGEPVLAGESAAAARALVAGIIVVSDFMVGVDRAAFVAAPARPVGVRGPGVRDGEVGGGALTGGAAGLRGGTRGTGRVGTSGSSGRCDRTGRAGPSAGRVTRPGGSGFRGGSADCSRSLRRDHGCWGGIARPPPPGARRPSSFTVPTPCIRTNREQPGLAGEPAGAYW